MAKCDEYGGCFASEACERKALSYCICYLCKHQNECWDTTPKFNATLLKTNHDCFEPQFRGK